MALCSVQKPGQSIFFRASLLSHNSWSFTVPDDLIVFFVASQGLMAIHKIGLVAGGCYFGKVPKNAPPPLKERIPVGGFACTELDKHHRVNQRCRQVVTLFTGCLSKALKMPAVEKKPQVQLQGYGALIRKELSSLSAFACFSGAVTWNVPTAAISLHRLKLNRQPLSALISWSH